MSLKDTFFIWYDSGWIFCKICMRENVNESFINFNYYCNFIYGGNTSPCFLYFTKCAGRLNISSS
jgi:hypothetical protein